MPTSIIYATWMPGTVVRDPSVSMPHHTRIHMSIVSALSCILLSLQCQHTQNIHLLLLQLLLAIPNHAVVTFPTGIDRLTSKLMVRERNQAAKPFVYKRQKTTRAIKQTKPDSRLILIYSLEL